MYLRISRRDVLAAAAQQPDDSAIDVRLRPDAIPLELKAPHIVGRRRFAYDLGEHRLDALWRRLPIRILGRIHAVDHPVLAIGLEEHVPALHSPSMQHDHHLAIRPLLGLVRAAVPDLHGATAVLALWDLTREVDVVQRVVLDVDGEVVLLGVRRDSSGHGPRDKYPILLEPEIPVQAARGMLLHHEPRRLGDFLWHLGAGFWCFLEIPLGFVLGELFRHTKRLGHRGFDLGPVVVIAPEAAPAEGEPADGHVPGLQLQGEDAFGQPGHPVPYAVDGRREGSEVEHRQRQSHRSSHDQPRTKPPPTGYSAEEITDDREPDDGGQSEPEAEEVEQEALQGEDSIYQGAHP